MTTIQKSGSGGATGSPNDVMHASGAPREVQLQRQAEMAERAQAQVKALLEHLTKNASGGQSAAPSSCPGAAAPSCASGGCGGPDPDAGLTPEQRMMKRMEQMLQALNKSCGGLGNQSCGSQANAGMSGQAMQQFAKAF